MILQATSKELNESIEQLKTYRNRLREEITSMSQKLRISKSSIEITLDENVELKNIDRILSGLITQRNKQSNENSL